MPIQFLPYKDTGYFSKLMCDYIAQEKATQTFYHRFPNIENFRAQLEEKQQFFTGEKREILVKQLNTQYQNTPLSEATQKNIDFLKSENTFTITTGHQLNLFTGPLYFLYKIFSVINLCEELKENYPECNFVPIYWMATEDHDFEEINFFNFKDEKIQWNRSASGAVGELTTEGLADSEPHLEKLFGPGQNAKELIQLFQKSYSNHNNLADATRYLANELFSEYGLVIIDGNDSELKKSFIPFAKRELTQKLSFQEITQTTEKLTNLGYPEQVHPREINLFYIDKNLRERIIKEDNRFIINETDIVFSEEEILKELENHPERFSPNALLRPLYQEVILPNLCYIGGGGELAYWFQLKDYFGAVKVPFPILLLRNSALLITEKEIKKLNRLEVKIEDLFLKQHKLITKHTEKLSEIDIDFSGQMEFLKKQFSDLYDLAEKTDKSFIGAVAAQEKKQLNGLKHLEKRLLKAQKRKFSDELNRLEIIQNKLFPNRSLQERESNFSEFYIDYGNKLMIELKENLNPLKQEFTIITLL